MPLHKYVMFLPSIPVHATRTVSLQLMSVYSFAELFPVPKLREFIIESAISAQPFISQNAGIFISL